MNSLREENRVGIIVWRNVTDNNPTNIAIEHEYITCYAKSKEKIASVWKSKLSDAKERLILIGKELNKKHKNPKELKRLILIGYRENKRFLGSSRQIQVYRPWWSLYRQPKCS